ncbi:MAG: trehalase family glycosidase [Candidatus Aminicenantes bacterium]|nr:trehalase family glycosidase [Candidatus Aminicenantes bacterium]
MAKKTILVLGLLLIGTPRLSPEIFYPWKNVYIGSLDGPGWPGLVIAPAKDCAFAFLLRVERAGEIAEGGDFYYLVSEVGPHSPDGLYARVKFDLGLPFKMARETPILMKPPPRKSTLTVEWSRRDETIVIGRILCPEDVRVTIVHYFPWDLKGEYSLLADGQVQGHCGAPGDPSYLIWTSRPGEPASAPAGGLARSYLPDADHTIAFAAGVGGGAQAVSDRIYRFKNAETIAAFIDEEAAAYEEKRVKLRGPYAGVPEAITNSLHWTALYQAGNHRLYTPSSRAGILPRPEGGGRDHWTIIGENSLFNSLELVLESQKLAVDALRAVLETQYPNGNIPNWRGRFGGAADRSQPPVGAFVVLKLFERLGDMEILREAYPYLQRWHDYWKAPRANGQARRDGNGDGLLEWGSDAELIGKNVPSWEKNATGRMRAGWESGQVDLPNWDDAPFNEESGTLMLNCVDLNSLYALDAWCLAEIASVLGRPVEVERYRDQYEKTRALVNSRLWNEKDGFYCDRAWDGRFSAHRAASAFFPLLARIPDEARAQKMLKHLLDPKQFWGDYVIPSISRDDPAFRPESQQSWRGAIQPSTNYLVYQGLKAYGYDIVASEFARKSAEMFLRSWNSFGLSPENFDSLTGEAGGERYQSGGPLAALIAVEEYLDFTPHEGFRFGILKPDGRGKLSRVLIQGRHYEVEAGNSSTILREEGETILAVDGGAVIRRFLYNESEVSFNVKSLKRRGVRLRLLKKGKYQLLVDGREMDVFSGSVHKFDVPEGDHTVLIQLLEDLEKEDLKEPLE